MYKRSQISLLVSCKKDSSVIDKDSYRDELSFLWSLAHSSVVVWYNTASVVHEYAGPSEAGAGGLQPPQ